MNYQDVITMKSNLDKVNFIEGANAKFVYAVAKNKSRLESIIKVMNKIIEPSAEITKYREETDKINLEFAEKDPDGTVGYVSHPLYGRAYRKIVGDGNPKSEHGKKIAALKEKYAKEIKEHEAKLKTYNDLCETDLPEDEFRKHMIDFEIVPDGLHPAGMSGCLAFIKDEEKEPKPKEPKSKK